MEGSPLNFYSAIEDFRRARQSAALERILARFSGRSADLLSYEEVRQKLHAAGGQPRGVRDILLKDIVGSVGRYTDFSRTFLPRRASDQERWAGVQVAMTALGQFPPIEVYQIGDAYFVLDGNHRVSVARRLGATHIQAYVTEVETKVPLSPETQPDDLILMEEFADFLNHTNLLAQRPAADLRVTLPGRYRVLEEQIEAYRKQAESAQGHPLSAPEAAAAWYDEVYRPVQQAIREQGLLDDFPGRTETDLYVWVSQHGEALQQGLGWAIRPAAAAADFARQQAVTPQRVASRVGERLRSALLPGELDTGPPPGQWRAQRGQAGEQRLFDTLLVPVSGTEVGWQALDQAILLAGREGASLLGLHIVASATERERPETQAVQARFNQRCDEAGVAGRLVIETGKVATTICERARWADLIVVNVVYPPGTAPLERLRSGFRSLVRSSPRPIWVAPSRAIPPTRALLAYDGSPMAQEALFVATYLAGAWQLPLTVLSIGDTAIAEANVAEAGNYLAERSIVATLRSENGPVGPTILEVAAQAGCDLILMGGYGQGAMREMLLGSAVDEVLRGWGGATLICR